MEELEPPTGTAQEERVVGGEGIGEDWQDILDRWVDWTVLRECGCLDAVIGW
jgi:hypothetical protein